MFEARALIKNSDEVKDKIEQLGAKFIGSYSFIDYIFSRNPINLNKEFLRIREYSKNNWPTGKINLNYKITDFTHNAKISKSIIKKEFEYLGDAFKFAIGLNFEKVLEFSRTGLEYKLDNHKLYFEAIENLGYSLEIENENQFYIEETFTNLGLNRIGDSLPQLVFKTFK